MVLRPACCSSTRSTCYLHTEIYTRNAICVQYGFEEDKLAFGDASAERAVLASLNPGNTLGKLFFFTAPPIRLQNLTDVFLHRFSLKTCPIPDPASPTEFPNSSLSFPPQNRTLSHPVPTLDPHVHFHVLQPMLDLPYSHTRYALLSFHRSKGREVWASDRGDLYFR